MPELKAIFAQECIPTQSVICAIVLQVNRGEETINLTPTTAFFFSFLFQNGREHAYLKYPVVLINNLRNISKRLSICLSSVCLFLLSGVIKVIVE